LVLGWRKSYFGPGKGQSCGSGIVADHDREQALKACGRGFSALRVA